MPKKLIFLYQYLEFSLVTLLMYQRKITVSTMNETTKSRLETHFCQTQGNF